LIALENLVLTLSGERRPPAVLLSLKIIIYKWLHFFFNSKYIQHAFAVRSPLLLNPECESFTPFRN